MAFGFHTSLTGSLTETIQSHLDNGCRGIQTCIVGTKLSTSDLTSTRSLLQESGFRLYTHTCVSLNPAAPAPAVFRAIVSLREELRPVNAVGASCVLHIGTQTTGKTQDGTLANVLTTLKSLPLTERSSGQRYPLLLENAAGEGRKLGSTLSDLEFLGRGIQEANLAVGFCLDTAHAFGAGLFDFSSSELIDDMFDMVDEAIGVGRLQLIHLNDSKIKFGGKADRHENIGYGHIWQGDKEPCVYLLRECKKRGIDVMLEPPTERIAMDYQWGCKARNS